LKWSTVACNWWGRPRRPPCRNASAMSSRVHAATSSLARGQVGCLQCGASEREHVFRRPRQRGDTVPRRMSDRHVQGLDAPAAQQLGHHLHRAQEAGLGDEVPLQRVGRHGPRARLQLGNVQAGLVAEPLDDLRAAQQRTDDPLAQAGGSRSALCSTAVGSVSTNRRKCSAWPRRAAAWSGAGGSRPPAPAGLIGHRTAIPRTETGVASSNYRFLGIVALLTAPARTARKGSSQPDRVRGVARE